jgi:[ribosomal protein S5]-alanine N-acetyltransferase
MSTPEHNPFDPFPDLATARLRLRCHTLADAEPMFRSLSDPRVARFAGKAPPATVDDVRAKLEMILGNLQRVEGISWALTDPSTGAYLGSAAIWRWDKPNFRGEVGYEIHPDYWGKGLMPEALRPICAFGFERMGLHSLEASTHPENTQSARVLEKIGFRKEAHFRESHFNQGVFEDDVVYSLLKGDG